MSFGKKGVVPEPENKGQTQNTYGLVKRSSPVGLISLSVSLVLAILTLGAALVLVPDIALPGAITVFVGSAAVLGILEVNIRAVIRAIAVAIRRDWKTMLLVMLFLMCANVALVSACFFGSFLVNLGGFERHVKGVVSGTDAARNSALLVPVIVVALGLLAVLNNFLLGKPRTAAEQNV